MKALPAAGALLFAPVAVVIALRFAPSPSDPPSRSPWIHRDGGFVGSDACAACHPDHHASWARTFHRTMTRVPDAATVLGAFDGRDVVYAGKRARPFADGGRFFVEVPAKNGATRRAEVALAVGSRRYQQYFERVETREGSALERLPILWHVGERRWLHLNTVFLNPDSDDWDEHRAVWNENCVFCHNTGPKPRAKRFDAPRVFDTKVAELGIACEACHGPGAEHVAALRDPVRRYAAHASEGPRAEIVQPERRDRERAVSVCGQCHGQRIPGGEDTAEAWLTTGPGFRSGDRLVDHASPLAPDTPVPASADPDLFRLRFWADGTPRLTAYEYQGIVGSACYLRGAMTCGSCHTMHGGSEVDVHGQIEPAKRGNDACLPCHETIGRDVSAHTRHRADGSGSICLECHMPRIVFGIGEVHRSHRIASPDPASEAESGKPGACTLCHLDRSPLWSARESARLLGRPFRAPARRADGAPLDLPDAVASILAGDAVQRAVFASAMGRGDAPIAPRDKAFLRVHLAVTLGDAYPSVRNLARSSLLRLEEELPTGLGPSLANVDTSAGPDERRRAVFDVLGHVARVAGGALAAPAPGCLVREDGTPDLAAIRALTELQGERAISIGE